MSRYLDAMAARETERQLAERNVQVAVQANEIQNLRQRIHDLESLNKALLALLEARCG